MSMIPISRRPRFAAGRLWAASLTSCTLFLVILALGAPLGARNGDDVSSVTAAPAEAPAEKPPSPLEVEERVGDLGTVVKGETPEYTFVVRNRGDEAVTIERIGTYVELEVLEHPGTLAPGESGNIRVRLDSMKLTGAHSSRIDVHVEGREEPIEELRLESNVVSRLAAHPGYSRWIYVRHEKEGTIRQTVYSNDGAEFEVVSVEAPMPAIRVEYREARPDERNEKVQGSQWIVEATLASDAPVGPIEGYLSVKTTHPDQRELRIPVSGFVRPVLFASPATGDLGTLENGRTRRAVYTVRNFATEPISLTGATANIPGVSAKVEPIEQGRRYRVVVELDLPGMETGPFAGKVTVNTDSEKVPSLEIDLHGRVVEGAETADSTKNEA